MANEGKECQRVMSNVAVLFIGLFISSLSLKAQVLSPLTIAEAHAKEAELTARIESVSKSAPPLDPKDMFESTADFNARKQRWTEDQEKLLEPVRRQLEKLQKDLYTDPAVKPEFVSYDADSELMAVRVSDGTVQVKISKGTAKKMHDSWAGIGFASSEKNSALVFEGKVFPVVSAGKVWKACKGVTAYAMGGGGGVKNAGGDGGGGVKNFGDPLAAMINGSRTSSSMKDNSSGVSAPSVLFKVDPDYSEEARNAKYSGTVLLSVVVGADGKACNITVLKGIGMGLDEKSVEAVAKWRFKPGMLDGKAVDVRCQIEVNFRLL